MQKLLYGGFDMSEIVFEGKHITLYNGVDNENKGVTLACGNSSMFLDYEATSELIRGLNKIAYNLYQTRSEIYQ
jgi:hypothetical protein